MLILNINLDLLRVKEPFVADNGPLRIGNKDLLKQLRNDERLKPIAKILMSIRSAMLTAPSNSTPR